MECVIPCSGRPRPAGEELTFNSELEATLELKGAVSGRVLHEGQNKKAAASFFQAGRNRSGSFEWNDVVGLLKRVGRNKTM